MLTEEKVLVTNIQRFSLHDGPGIRTTIFFKGCSLCCPWCSNPENIKAHIESYMKNGNMGQYGIYMSCLELYEEILKDKVYYGKTENAQREKIDFTNIKGGVTFSGGEPLLQIEKFESFMQTLNEEHIHMAIETSLFAPKSQVALALKYIDLFYIDVKIMDKTLCNQILHGDLELFLSNLDIVSKANKVIVMRVPVINGYTDSADNTQAVIELVKKHKPHNVELIKEHNLGSSKYVSLGLQIPKYKGIDSHFLEKYYLKIKETGISVDILEI